MDDDRKLTEEELGPIAAVLRAEKIINELRAENERLHAKIINSGPEDDWEERGAAAQLRAEVERLRAALFSIAHHELRDHEDYDAVCDMAAAALADQGKG